jgi:hypothetical protein
MGIVIGHGRRIVIRLPQVPLPEGERSWPLDARLALFVLEAQADEATTGASDQYTSGPSFDAPVSQVLQQSQQRPQPRRDERVACRIAADLLFASSTSSASAASNESDLPPECASSAAYVRDVSPGHAGFICRAPLEPGQTCWLRLEQADGSTVTLRGIVGRCRSFMEGWSEGVIRFALEATETAAEQEQPLRVAV